MMVDKNAMMPKTAKLIYNPSSVSGLQLEMFFPTWVLILNSMIENCKKYLKRFKSSQ